MKEFVAQAEMKATEIKKLLEKNWYVQCATCHTFVLNPKSKSTVTFNTHTSVFPSHASMVSMGNGTTSFSDLLHRGFTQVDPKTFNTAK